MYKQRGKKEPSIRWLRVGIENSNNFSLRKSTLDTLLLRTYKQTELLCTHINKCHSMRLWLLPCSAPSSHTRLHRTQPASEPWELSACRIFSPGFSGTDEGRGETPIQARTGVHVALRPSHSRVCGPFVFLLLVGQRDSIIDRRLLCPDIPHPS